MIADYFKTLAERFGGGWNRFWFLPSAPTALSAMRPLVGLIALWWHSTYTADLLAFFGPGGVIPLELLSQWTGNADGGSGAVTFSYFNAAHTPGAISALHWFGFFVLVAFTIGLLTRLTTPLALVVVLSYIHRGPMLASEFEPVLAMVMAYLAASEVLALFERWEFGLSTFLGDVCGGRFSVDAWLRGLLMADNSARGPWLYSATVGTRLMQVHLAAIYAATAAAMLSTETWWLGDAVWWLVARPDQSSFALSRSLDGLPLVVNLWSHAILAYQILFPILVWNRLARPLVLAAGVLVWTLVAVASSSYLFAAMMLTANLAFVSPEFVEQLLGSAGKAGDSAVGDARSLEAARA